MPRDRKYWTYIVASQSGTLYIGMTNNLERRIREHKDGAQEGFASKYGCNRLVYWESFDDSATQSTAKKNSKAGSAQRRSH